MEYEKILGCFFSSLFLQWALFSAREVSSTSGSSFLGLLSFLEDPVGWLYKYFPPTTNNDANNHLYYRTLTSLRASFDYVWGTPTWRIATVVKRRVTWVKTKNRWFTVTLQCVSIQVSTDFPGYFATCTQHGRCDAYKESCSVQLSSVDSMVFPCYKLNGKHF